MDDNKFQDNLDVIIMAKRLALLYYYFVVNLQNTFSEQELDELLERVIWQYGTHCGQEVKKRVEEKTLPVTIENFSKGEDLPKTGWQKSVVNSDRNNRIVDITYCPFAEVWKNLNMEKWGRKYCLVDQAKYHAYNNSRCFHDKNLLDGDSRCRIRIEGK